MNHNMLYWEQKAMEFAESIARDNAAPMFNAEEWKKLADATYRIALDATIREDKERGK